MGNIYVHCGLPKTGTTSIQKYLASVRRELEQNGFAYPDLGVSADRSAHHNLSCEILNKTEDFAPERGTISDLLDYLRHPARPPNVILSSEGLSNCLTDNRGALIDFLARCAGQNDALHLVFTFRKLFKVAESRYLYSVRDGKKPRPILVRRTSRWIMDLAAAFDELQTALGPRFVSCDIENRGGDAIGAFKAAVGLDALPLPRAERNFNTRVGLKKLALLYRLRSEDDGHTFSARELFKTRRRILGMPELPGERYDYHVVPFETANDIQRAARDGLPSYIAREIEESLAPETEYYEAVDLRSVALSDDDLALVRAALHKHVVARIPWLKVRKRPE